MSDSPHYKAMYKSELARAAGVSVATFRRWIKDDREELKKTNCTPNSKMLTPAAVEFLCKKYCIFP